MPAFAPSSSGSSFLRLAKPVHAVARGGYVDPFIVCSGFSQNHGSGGCSAQLTMPTRRWDEHQGELKDQEVALWFGVSPAVGATGAPDLLCYVNVDSAVKDPSTSSVSFTATTIAPRLRKVSIGPKLGTNVVEFKNRVKGSTTAIGNWTPRKVLQKLFDTSHLDSYWRSKVRLGNTQVLDDGWDSSTAPDFIFTNANLLSAIDQIISHCGDVYYVERFSASLFTYLDFFRVSDPADGYSNIVVCQPGEYAEEVGANAQKIENTASTDEVYSRIYGFGDHRRIMISVSTESAVAPLIRTWDTGSTIVYTDPVTSTTYTHEQLVLHDANLSKGERTPESYTSAGGDIEDVFRKYTLPPEIQQFTIAKDNALKNLLGQRMSVQVIKVPLRLAAGTGEYLAFGTAEAGYYEEIKSVDLHLDEGYFVLGEPAINVKGIKPGPDGSIIHEYEEAEVGITLTLELPPLMHDTGQNDAITGDLSYPWAPDGETMMVTNEKYEYAQLTNADLDLSLGQVGTGGPEYNCTYRHPDTGVWHHITSKQVLQDDYKSLRSFTRSVLREKGKRNRSYDVTIPWLTRAFPLGSKLVINGQANFVYDTYAVAGATFDFKNNTTTLSIHTVRPPQASLTAFPESGQDQPVAPAMAAKAAAPAAAAPATPAVTPVAYQGPSLPPTIGYSAPGQPGLHADGSITEFRNVW